MLSTYFSFNVISVALHLDKFFYTNCLLDVKINWSLSFAQKHPHTKSNNYVNFYINI